MSSRATARYTALLACLSAAALAQEKPEPMTLTQALEYAQAHQPSQRAIEARAQAALADAFVPRAQWFPRIGASVQAVVGTANNTSAVYLGSNAVDLPRIGGTRSADFDTASYAPNASTIAALGVRQELFDFGKIAAQGAVLDATAQATRYRAQSQALDLQLGVKEAFFAVLASHGLLLAAEGAYQRSKEERDFAAAGVHSGLRSPIDLTRAEADLMRLDAGRIRADGSLVAAQEVLGAVIGFVGGAVDATPSPDAPAQPPHLKEALEQVGTHDPDILEWQSRLESQQQRSRSTLMELLPDFALSSTFSGRAGGATPSSGPTPSTGWLPDVPNWDVGVVLNWQIFDASVLARRSASQRYERAAEADVDAVRLKASATVHQAYSALDVANRALPALQRSVEAAQANHAQALARFRAGLGTSIEIADADAVLTDAEIQAALGLFEFDRARARISRAIAEP